MGRLKKIVIACDSFKGSLTSAQVASAAAGGVRRVLPEAEVVEVAVADGGEGTMAMLVEALRGRYAEAQVSDPLGREITARYGIVADREGTATAVIEMAAASGLTLLADGERNPLLTSTRGTGQLICDAYGRGCRRFVVGIGGSATNDGGAGMLRALGVRLLDADGHDLPEGGAALQRLSRIDTSEACSEILRCPFTVICDVDNPLTGSQGASAVFGPQKGATASDVALLDSALSRYARCIADATGRHVASAPGAGAAGGMGAAFLAFFDARLRPGIDTTLDAIRFADIIRGADLIITGEGRLDSQTLRGKTPVGVLRHGREEGIPVVAIGGAAADPEALCSAGFAAVLSIQPCPLTLAEAMEPATAAANVAATAAQLVRLINI